MSECGLLGRVEGGARGRKHNIRIQATQLFSRWQASDDPHREEVTTPQRHHLRRAGEKPHLRRQPPFEVPSPRRSQWFVRFLAVAPWKAPVCVAAEIYRGVTARASEVFLSSSMLRASFTQAPGRYTRAVGRRSSYSPNVSASRHASREPDRAARSRNFSPGDFGL